MTPWQKRMRLVMAAVGVAVVALVLLTIRERPSGPGGEEIERIDPKAVKESSGGVHMPMRDAESSGPIAFEHMLEYADGTVKLIDVRATTERDGRTFVIEAREGHVPADQSNIRLVGDVRLSSGEDLEVRTSEAEYNQTQRRLRTRQRVGFTKGPMSGTAQGMTYDEERDLLTLLARVKVRVAAAEGRRPADVTAGFAEYARAEKSIRFDRSVRMVREGQVISAASAVARLSGDEQRLEALELHGGARIETPDAAPGGLEAMESREMNLTYADDGETLERAVLSGKAVIAEAGRDGQARRIAAEMIDLMLTAGGGIERMVGEERVQLTLPAQGETPGRIVRSRSMSGTGGPDGGLAAARFEGGVEFRESGRDAGERVGRSRTLEVAMGASGEIEDARFAGATRFEDGPLRTSSDQATYDVGKGTLQLTKSEKGRDPGVEDDQLTVEASEIEVGFEGPVLDASGGVRSVLRPTPSGTNGGRDRAMPGMLDDDEPVYVTATRLQYDGAKGLAVYTGRARLWQGDTTIQGHSIVLDEKSGNLGAAVDPAAKAPGLVRSAFVLEDRHETTGEVRQVPSTAAGKTLKYEEEHRRATYTTEARVTGPQGDVQADRIEMYFEDDGGSLDRAEAYDRVRMKDEQRAATGSRLTYFGQEGRYLMTGAPVRIVRECDETFGKSLTFWRSTDRILVDGNEENRTLTKTGGTCAGQRSK